MTCLAAQSELRSELRQRRSSDTWDLIRETIFWGFVLLVIASPAALGVLILAHA